MRLLFDHEDKTMMKKNDISMTDLNKVRLMNTEMSSIHRQRKPIFN